MIDGQHDFTWEVMRTEERIGKTVLQRKIDLEIAHNMRVKTYPDGGQIVMCAERPIFREPGWELSDKWDAAEPKRGGDRRGREAEDLERARRRARAAVYDLGRASSLGYFVTLTLDASRVNRYDDAITGKQLRRWLSNQVQRRGLAYVLVPEHHKDGAIHFHGLINGALEMIDSGTIKRASGGKPQRPRSAAQRAAWLAEGGQVVYNLPGWSWGYSTALELTGDRRKAVAYVCKYIGKDSAKIGGRWYYSGGDLSRPDVTYGDADFEALRAETSAPEWVIDRLGCRCINFDMEE